MILVQWLPENAMMQPILYSNEVTRNPFCVLPMPKFEERQWQNQMYFTEISPSTPIILYNQGQQ
jgi:hypothetical protein